MKQPFWIVCMFIGGAAYAAGFLQPASFPKTFSDLSFSERVAIIAEGYEPFEKVFDANGACISGCPYKGFTLAEQRALDAAAESETIISDLTEFDGARVCSDYNEQNKYEKNPLGEPLKGCPIVTSEYGWRSHPVLKERKFHEGVDLQAAIGTPVYATGAGRVVIAQNDKDKNPCGKYVKIQHPSGMYSLYCHLSEILVKQGDLIQPGCLIAKSGNTGRSTGPHLHYAVINSRGHSEPPRKWMLCDNHKK